MRDGDSGTARGVAVAPNSKDCTKAVAIVKPRTIVAIIKKRAKRLTVSNNRSRLDVIRLNNFGKTLDFLENI